VAAIPHAAYAQGALNTNPPKTAAPVERLGPTTLRVGTVQVDTTKREVSVKGRVTGVNVLEFIAVTKGGFKGYESALELDTNAINFNVALLLIGLDPAHSVVPKMHFDPATPQGDPVEIWVDWDDPAAPSGRKRVRAEQLVYNTQTNTTLSEGPWVYTGSVFVTDSKAYLADIEGSLIGFVHTPAPIIESPRTMSPSSYGNDLLNPALKLKTDTPVVLTVHALAPAK
jgi:hypothetical protein